jgi:ATP adenylyltransferase
MTSQMPRLWAPWRGEWIQSQKDPHPQEAKCPFCELPASEPSEENLVLFKNEKIFVVMNKFPYNPGHLMVIPREHVASPQELDPSIWNEINQAIPLTMDCISKGYAPQGYNLGMNLGHSGGAGIPGHIHWHILPRWAGDTNFMPLLAETKALPTHNLTIYRTLEAHFEGFAERLSTAMMRSK